MASAMANVPPEPKLSTRSMIFPSRKDLGLKSNVASSSAPMFFQPAIKMPITPSAKSPTLIIRRFADAFETLRCDRHARLALSCISPWRDPRSSADVSARYLSPSPPTSQDFPPSAFRAGFSKDRQALGPANPRTPTARRQSFRDCACLRTSDAVHPSTFPRCLTTR